MNIEDFRKHCLTIKGATESLPFIRHNVLVFKVMEKMFAYVPLEPKNGEFIVHMKCDPQRSVELRERYKGVARGEHDTLLWNGVNIESDVPDQVIIELVNHSAEEVIKKLSKAKRKEYYEL